ncbi:conserved hypothetical protein [Desulfamplus magnetovallimortis]|uniref:Uncharacterized protein n=1 Tax=Desulfamplus magnetovallimortis TaxID=1246637 RepID=A0A1W1H505_9BACT|nr:PglZ domain-containing protein [Desulfamplus magnetovallimortis]SLM27560.1 conserved hypothetical protein [Desulfamplus magnetovallimortis]
MSIAQFIQTQTLLPRLQKKGVLTVYDPDGRYRDVCLELADEHIKVVDASQSSIESREAALSTFKQLGENNPQVKGMVVYIPVKKPMTDEERQHDPFSIYTACGTIFPEGDGDGYMDLCIKAKPDHATEIRKIFDNDPNPGFAVIDAVGSGKKWPNLRALLNKESARDILLVLLSPDGGEMAKLKRQKSWLSEASDLVMVCLGLKLKTDIKSWAAIADELWRFLLFSEFAFDFPGDLPQGLSDVPCAPKEAKSLVFDLCDGLRNDLRTQTTYIDRAETIEKALDLPLLCSDIKDLGDRDTFPFEERTFLKQGIDSIIKNNRDKTRLIIERHSKTVWVGKGESQAQWGLVSSALQLVTSCDDLLRALGRHSANMGAIIDFYLTGLREADRLQREFEQSVSDYIDNTDIMAGVIDHARLRYRGLVDKVQTIFIRHLEKEGWPPGAMLHNMDVFDKLIAPKLMVSGHRVAYLLIDALRYELGVELEKQLSENGQVDLKAACAAFPTITPVGMASLLPGAGTALSLKKGDKGIIPMFEDVEIPNVSKRMEVFKKRFGQRFNEMKLADFINSKKTIPESVELLVLRSVDIDNHMESNPETTIGLIHDTLKRIRVAIHKLEKMGFQDVVIATDHGFFLNTYSEAGDVCSKPQGDWLNVHDRCMMGKGSEDFYNFLIPAEKLGIRGDYSSIAGPKSMAPYRDGLIYFHGGASLQEAIVPVLTLSLNGENKNDADNEPQSVVISYKNGAKKISVRFPVIDIMVAGDLFSAGSDLEILVEAHDKKGNVVGEAKAGGVVNPTTGTVFIKRGEQIRLTLKMQMNFEGKFTVKALNPVTMAAYNSINLETDYMV